MLDALDLWKKPQAQEINMLAGWRQWADAGSVSSGLPEYLVTLLGAEPIGTIKPDGFYLFQVPGTYDLMRPVVTFEEGFPKSLESQHNDLFYAGDEQRGLIILVGDEPHMDIERYVATLLSAVKKLGVKRIVGLGGMYAELPYDKERLVSSNYSLQEMKQEMSQLAVDLSDYQGGASIGAYVCRRAFDQGIEYASFYAFVPSYQLSSLSQIASTIRLENDYMAWLGVMRRVDFMLKLHLDLTDLEKRSKHLVEMMDAKVDEIENEAPQLGLSEKLKEIAADFKETPFITLDDVWEDQLRHLLDKFDDEEPPAGKNPED